MNKTYTFIVDTDQYSGNFDCYLAAYLLGYYEVDGMHPDSKHFASLGLDHISKKIQTKINYVIVEDDPIFFSIYLTKNRNVYESVALYFKQELTADEINYLKNKAETFKQCGLKVSSQEIKEVKVTGFRLIETETLIKTKETESFI